MTADRVAAIALALLGGVAIWQALKLPYWVDRAPGPGFLPCWLGVLLVATSAAQAARRQRFDSRPLDETADPSAPIIRGHAAQLFGLTALAAAAAPLLGFSLTIGLLTAAAAWLLDRDRPLQALTAAIVMPVVVWLVFVRWLEVPFPR
jgi:hypothetical protein